MEAIFFVPINNHYVCDDLSDIARNRREPELYQWLNNLNAGAVLFDIGTSYGQESVLASSLTKNHIQVVGFDCGLYQSHFCALNRTLNDKRFRFVFAAVSDVSGEMITLISNSDTHIPRLHKKNVPYEYEVMTLALDDFSATNNLFPTHLKIDVDGAELNVLKGASKILSSTELKEVFIEVDNQNSEVIRHMASYGFIIEWQIDKEHNSDILFSRR
jgi:FkbM family methyltransferase